MIQAMKFIRYLCVLYAVALSGCTFSNPFVKHEYVEIPVPADCVTWQPTREPSHFDLLKGDEPLWVQIRDLLVDRENDQRFIEGQDAVIAGCR